MNLTTHTDTPNPLSDLPFVRVAHGSATDLWAVERTGDWSIDNATGRAHADDLIAHMSASGNMALLGQVSKAVAASGWDGVAAGFWNRMAERVTG